MRLGVTKHFFEYKGMLFTLKELAKFINIDYPVTYKRIIVFGWSIEKTVATPIKRKPKSRGLKVDDGIEGYVVTMIRYYTKEHRHRCYRQLRRDFEEIQMKYLRVA